MNKKIEGRRATSNNNQGLAVGSPANNGFMGQASNANDNS